MKIKTITLQKQEIPENLTNFQYMDPLSLKINKKFSDEYPKLVTTDYEMTKQSIVKNGIITPLILSKNGTLIDGHNRSKIAIELGARVPVVIWNTISTKDQEEAAIALNLLRRQLSGEARRTYLKRLFPDILIKKNRKQSVDYDIANHFGISASKVRQDIAKIRKGQRISIAERGSLDPNEEEIKRANSLKTSSLEAIRIKKSEYSEAKMNDTAKIINQIAGTISRKGKVQMSIENVLILQPSAQKLLVAINKRIEEQ